MVAAQLKAVVEVKGVPDATAKLRDFQAKVQEVNRNGATATLAANVESNGFRRFDALLDEMKLKTAKPIEQTVKVKTDRNSFSRALSSIKSDAEAIKKVWNEGAGGSGKGLGTALGEAFMPFGPKGTAIAALSPVIMDLAGALTAVAGSAAEAAAGVGALTIGAGSVAGVGLVGIASVAVPAIASLKKLTTAQGAYNTAIDTYGRNSKQAATALQKLRGAERLAGPGASALVKDVGEVKKRWTELTRPGQQSFFGLLDDAVNKLQQKMPLLAGSADRSMAAVRHGFDIFQNKLTGGGFDHFIHLMTNTFARIVPKISHDLANWAIILGRIAEAAVPGLMRVTNLFGKWTEHILESTNNSHRLTGIVNGLVGQFLSWVHLLAAAGKLLVVIFGAGAGQGQRLVDDLTGKLKEWTGWIEHHQAAVHQFFAKAAEVTRNLASALGNLVSGFLPTFMQLSEAMKPISEGFLAVAKALNSIKIGNISALTALVGAILVGRGVGKVGGALGGLRSIGGMLGGGAAAGGAVTTVEGGAVAAGGIGAAASRIGSILGKGIAVAAGGVVAAEIGARIAEKVTGSHFLEGQSVITSITHGFNTKGVKTTEESALHRLRSHEAAAGRLSGVQGALLSGSVTTLPDIQKLSRQASVAAAQAWGKGTPAWREATGKNMLAVVAAIKTGEAAGVITARQGQQAIAHALREYHLISGDDPFHIAAGFARSWEKAGRVNQEQIAGQLGELRQMPPRARAIAQLTMLEQAKQIERHTPQLKGLFSTVRSEIVTELRGTKKESLLQMMALVRGMASGAGAMDTAVSTGLKILGHNVNSALHGFGVNKKLSFALTNVGKLAAGVGLAGLGFQRGGPITMGAPSGDSVPAMLERGEYVLNRNAVSAIGVDNLHAINFGAAPRFAKGGAVHEPHLAGPGPLRDLGQGGLHAAYGAAQRYLHLHGGRRGHGLPGLNVPTGPIEAMARAMVEHVWGRDQWAPFAAVVNRESGWNPTALNASSGAAGLAQALPASKYPKGAWPYRGLNSAKLQLAWMVNYIRERYGDPAHAWAHEMSAGWYASGGLAGKRSPLRVIDWAKHFLGSGDRWGSPGEWCGTFLGADMKAHGIEPPGNYAFSGNWANWGAPISRGHVNPGDILTYDGQHVAMFIGNGQQINGNWGGRVAISTAFQSVRGKALSAIRRPPYEPGSEAHSGSSVSTPHVSISGSLPSMPEACTKEIAHRRSEVKRERSRQARDPANARVIAANIHALERRIEALLRQRMRLLIARRAQIPRFLGSATKNTPGLIADKRFAYEKAAEYAERVVALEPTEGNIAAYIHGSEEPAYSSLLDTEASWRNSIIEGEAAVIRKAHAFREQIRHIRGLRRHNPGAYAKNAYKIPALEAAIRSLRESYDPQTRSGTLSDMLKEVQGTGGSHELLSSLPSVPQANGFGGLIFQTQNTIRELGLKLKEGAGGAASESASARVALLEELLTQANQRTAAQAIYHKTFGEGIPYAGAYAAGGIVSALVGEAGPELATFPAGTRIHSAPETATALAPSVVVNFYEGEQRAEVEVNGQKVEAIVNRKDRRGARTASRGLAVAGRF